MNRFAGLFGRVAAALVPARLVLSYLSGGLVCLGLASEAAAAIAGDNNLLIGLLLGGGSKGFQVRAKVPPLLSRYGNCLLEPTPPYVTSTETGMQRCGSLQEHSCGLR